MPAVNDAYLQNLLRSRVGIDLGDAKVATDYLAWGLGRGGAKFVTADVRFLAAVRAGLATFLADQGVAKPTVADFLESPEFRARLP